VGTAEGDSVGLAVGACVGVAVGECVGTAVGAAVGDLDGTAVGWRSHHRHRRLMEILSVHCEHGRQTLGHSSPPSGATPSIVSLAQNKSTHTVQGPHGLGGAQSLWSLQQPWRVGA
jgi:outer membrane lipoprotein SlyB